MYALGLGSRESPPGSHVLDESGCIAPDPSSDEGKAGDDAGPSQDEVEFLARRRMLLSADVLTLT